MGAGGEERENLTPNTEREFSLNTSANGAEIFKVWHEETILLSALFTA